MDWYLKVLKQYADFSGRARRKEYWMFVLFNIIVSFMLGIVDALTGMTMLDGSIGTLGFIYTLAILVPSLAVGARRLHDIGRSGWWMLIGLVPVIGFIVLIVWYASEGTRGDNRFGADPKADDAGGVPAMA